MGILTFLEASLKLGIPMVFLSWSIFTWLYGSEKISREADRKSTAVQLRAMKKSFKNKTGGKTSYVVDKWMWFGGGFYGLAGLWTFFVIEVSDIFRVIINPSSVYAAMSGGFVSFIVDVLLNQLGNLITAFIWFSYWNDDNVVVCLLVAYFGYWLGIELAKRGHDVPIQKWLQKIKSLRP